jgi:acyl-CoA synthetase (AMP-forming)/AMP-acid ligase II
MLWLIYLNCIETHLSISFALMSLRAVSVNLNWRSPAKTLAELTAKTSCKLLFATEKFRAKAQEIGSACGVTVIYLEAFQMQLDGASHSLCRSLECQPEDTAVVFFTSGSTSLPKAVPHTHASLMWLAETYYRAFPEPYDTANPNASTLCFSLSFMSWGFRSTWSSIFTQASRCLSNHVCV